VGQTERVALKYLAPVFRGYTGTLVANLDPETFRVFRLLDRNGNWHLRAAIVKCMIEQVVECRFELQRATRIRVPRKAGGTTGTLAQSS
jgi:hypothetical protein